MASEVLTAHYFLDSWISSTKLLIALTGFLVFLILYLTFNWLGFAFLYALSVLCPRWGGRIAEGGQGVRIQQLIFLFPKMSKSNPMGVVVVQLMSKSPPLVHNLSKGYNPLSNPCSRSSLQRQNPFSKVCKAVTH